MDKVVECNGNATLCKGPLALLLPMEVESARVAVLDVSNRSKREQVSYWFDR